MDFDTCVFITANGQTNCVMAANEWKGEDIRIHGHFGTHTNKTVVRIHKVRAG